MSEKPMDAGLPDEAMIRGYLLGHVDATSSKAAEEFQERLLADDDLAEWADLIEDEILEEYLEGTLNSSDRQAVETHFLRPPERQEKLRRMRLLQRHLATIDQAPPKAHWHSHLRQYAGAAAGMLAACAAVVWALDLRHGMQIELARHQQELAHEHQRSAALEQQIAQLRDLKQPPVVLLSLTEAGIPRKLENLPLVTIGQGTRLMHVDILLPDPNPNRCDVRLESVADGTSGPSTIWHASVAPKRSSAPNEPPERGLLILDVPARNITTGIYQFVVTRKSMDQKALEDKYRFQIHIG